ncbi:hypothetical protein AALP_AA7G195400 [Arabis alpina]|uniref:Uncharacterized protein n=1 Tax=Arabis alpina TaxID=50452 RepID=A0A087GJ66_ARAAL|nr:hypothetical protein AALP_AA7G195400 [Arabis alpina]
MFTDSKRCGLGHEPDPDGGDTVAFDPTTSGCIDDPTSLFARTDDLMSLPGHVDGPKSSGLNDKPMSSGLNGEPISSLRCTEDPTLHELGTDLMPCTDDNAQTTEDPALRNTPMRSSGDEDPMRGDAANVSTRGTRGTDVYGLGDMIPLNDEDLDLPLGRAKASSPDSGAYSYSGEADDDDVEDDDDVNNDKTDDDDVEADRDDIEADNDEDGDEEEIDD